MNDKDFALMTRLVEKLRKTGLDATFDNISYVNYNKSDHGYREVQERRPTLLIRDYKRGIQITLTKEGIEYMMVVGSILSELGREYQELNAE